MLIEGWSPLDAAYMIVITISTVGYGEPHTMSQTGRAFTVVLVFVCLVAMSFWTASLTSYLVDGDLNGQLLAKRMRKMISKLRNHTIVCGASLMGGAVVEQLAEAGRPVVLVDTEEESLKHFREYYDVLTVSGSGTDELTLAEAGILDAGSVVVATDCEMSNLLIAISCKDLCGEIRVFAVCNDPTIANRMRKAGVDEVLSPPRVCGERTAAAILA